MSRLLILLLLSGCAAPKPFVLDIGNPSLACLEEGLVLRFILVEGAHVVKAMCVPPPQPEGTRS